jgi:HD superfamily phosphodiesterase
MNSRIDDETYKKIKEYALSKMAKSTNARHDDEHVTRVKNNALKIIKLLGIEDKVDKNLIKTTCLLHDFSYTVRKSNPFTYIFEGHIERRVLRPILEKFDLSEQAKETIIGAVYRHAHSYPFGRLNKERDIYTKILQDADTLDFFNCIRLNMFIVEHDRGIFKGIRKYLSTKFIEYGINNLGNFLNYPELAKSFFTDPSMKCL